LKTLAAALNAVIAAPGAKSTSVYSMVVASTGGVPTACCPNGMSGWSNVEITVAAEKKPTHRAFSSPMFRMRGAA
jgi:hypothetical protein